MNRPKRPASATLSSMVLPLAWGLLLATALAGASAVALTLALDGAHAAETAHQRQPGDASQHQSDSRPSLAASDRPDTTPALRDGMTRLRQTLHGHTAAPQDSSAALGLQRSIEADIAALIEKCDLPDEADAVLHGVLVTLNQGAAALAGPAGPDAGLQQLNDGLLAYTTLFAGPHWSRPDNRRN